MHNCDLMEERIIDLTFDEIDFNQRSALLSEIKNCCRCRELYNSASETLLLVEQTSEAVKPGADFWPGYNERLRSRLPGVSRPERRRPAAILLSKLNIFKLMPAPIAAGLIVALIAGGTLFIIRYMNRNEERLSVAETTPEKRSETIESELSRSKKETESAPQIPDVKSKPRSAPSVINRPAIKTEQENLYSEIETAQHFENVQLLLRSIRNAYSTNNEDVIDISLEKRMSRELLGKNIIFRRGAEKGGNSEKEELLSSVEILLIDISNLPDRSSQNDLRIIKSLLQKENLIVTLQPHAAPYSEKGF